MSLFVKSSKEAFQSANNGIHQKVERKRQLTNCPKTSDSFDLIELIINFQNGF